MEEQLAVFQLQTMAFAIKPEELRGVLLTDLGDPDKDLSDYGYGKGSLNDWIDDICAAYTELWKIFGPFAPTGVSAERIDIMQKDPQWQEFSAKMRVLYSLVYDAQSSNVAYPWVTYWLTGMTEEETLFKSSENEIQLQCMIDDRMTVRDILNSFAVKKEAGENGLDFKTGF